jgi:HlyD family secretion protein
VFEPLARQIALNPGDSVLKDEFTTKKALMERELNGQLQDLQDAFSSNNAIRSSADGTILSANITQGEYASVGQTTFTMTRSGRASENTQLLIYVPIAEGKRIVEGMEVDVSPSTVNTQEYGKMVGRVRSVSEYAVAVESVAAKLNNNDLVAMFMSQGAVLEVQVELLRDMDSLNGYKWSASTGPDSDISAGVMCMAEFHVDTYHPIEFVLPFLKRIL